MSRLDDFMRIKENTEIGCGETLRKVEAIHGVPHLCGHVPNLQESERNLSPIHIQRATWER